MDLAVGTQVTPVVRLVRPLGRGGMGSVWIAEHLTLRTEVVVKFMADALAADPVSLARFSREASAAAAVKSPHVVQMLDHGFTSDGTPFIVMELLDGEDLKHRLARDGVVPFPELALIVSQTCKALGRAHLAGIIHRDIKPDNIFLCRTDDGEPFVKLLDFGIAKSGAPTDFHMTQTGVVVGTPYYMSPEQAIGSPPVDALTDLWSLGVVAYEAMTGVRPFDGPTLGALTMAICSERPPAPSSSDARVPAIFDTWMARACARDRTGRFETAKAMSDAFGAAVRVSTFPGPMPQGAAVPRPPSNPPGPGNPQDRRADLGVRRSSPPPAMPLAAPSPPVLPRPPTNPPMAASVSGFATTTSPISVAQDAPDTAPAAAPRISAPAFEASTPRPTLPHAPPPSRRGPFIALGGMLMVLGVAGGFLFAQRDDPSRSASPPPSPPAVASPSPRDVSPTAPSTSAAANAQAVAPSSTAPSTSLPSLPTTVDPQRPPHAAADSAHASGIRPTRPAPTTTPSAPPPLPSPGPSSAPAGCDPPYYFDAAHNKVFKKECL